MSLLNGILRIFQKTIHGWKSWELTRETELGTEVKNLTNTYSAKQKIGLWKLVINTLQASISIIYSLETLQKLLVKILGGDANRVRFFHCLDMHNKIYYSSIWCFVSMFNAFLFYSCWLLILGSYCSSKIKVTLMPEWKTSREVNFCLTHSA